MSLTTGLIILDRDGVINEMVVDPEHGFIDSPMHPSQVRLLPGVAHSIAQLNKAGFAVRIATNQPAAAKGKTTQQNLLVVHDKVLQLVKEGGAEIFGSHICWHKSEDNCLCRKPKTGLLQQAMRDQGEEDVQRVWMVGDGVTDVEAGKKLGVHTVFLGPQKCDACKCFEQRGIKPDQWFASLREFVINFLEREPR